MANDVEGTPYLKARLDRDDACYPSGGEAVVTVRSEKGIYLYILSLAADHTATILYPNRLMPGKPLAADKFQFPSLQLRKEEQLNLLLYPMDGKDTTEAIKVVASREPLDFSFLPRPENALFTGAQGGDMKKMLQVLKKAHDWKEQTLKYWVGPKCQ